MAEAYPFPDLASRRELHERRGFEAEMRYKWPGCRILTAEEARRSAENGAAIHIKLSAELDAYRYTQELFGE